MLSYCPATLYSVEADLPPTLSYPSSGLTAMPSVTDIIAKLCAEQMRKLLEICLDKYRMR